MSETAKPPPGASFNFSTSPFLTALGDGIGLGIGVVVGILGIGIDGAGIFASLV